MKRTVFELWIRIRVRVKFIRNMVTCQKSPSAFLFFNIVILLCVSVWYDVKTDTGLKVLR